MSNEALYRKYRPTEFTDVVGQSHIVQVLERAVKNGDISHAYLFSGTRGIGKTSIARILARKLGASERDIYEIDAASNRGIDDVRELKEGVNTQPFESDFKVYIIDEAHMLTTPAFNALLKTLEEPPEFVVFVLATTEMHKLPETIISRCEVHEFRAPTREILMQMASEIAEQEGYELTPDAAERIAGLGDGSFRDMQGVLQKVLRSNDGGEVTLSDVEVVTGAPSGGVVREVFESIIGEDSNRALTAVKSARDKNIDQKALYEELLEWVRAVLLLRFAPDLVEKIKDQLSPDNFELIKEESKNGDSNISANTLHSLLLYYSRLGHTHTPELPLELALMRILAHNND